MKQILLSLLFALLISPAAAEACSCAGSATVCSAYGSADGVFVGFVQRVVTPANQPRERVGDLEVTQFAYVQVERVFKGIDQPEVVFRTFNTSCDVSYKEGQRWLFYAGYDPKSKTWSIGYCGRSRFIEAAVDDLRYLEALPGSVKQSRVSGTVSHSESDPVDGLSRPETVAGVKVTIAGMGKTYESFTDENGVYEIYGLPPGSYTVNSEVPPGLKLRFPMYHGEVDYSDQPRPRVVLKAGSCAGVDFLFSADISISGKVLASDGRPLPNVCLSLQPKGKPVAGTWIFDCTDKEGRYRLKEIPPGEYLIVVNYHGKISSNEPFPTAYYPGVFAKELAEVLVVSYRDNLQDRDIRIPSEVATSVVQGIVQFSDGKPAADLLVQFSPEMAKEGFNGEARTTTDSEGRFSLTVLRGIKGRVYGSMSAYPNKYVACPQLEKLIKAQGRRFVTFETGSLSLEVLNDVQGIKLAFSFPYCEKADRQ